MERRKMLGLIAVASASLAGLVVVDQRHAAVTTPGPAVAPPPDENLPADDAVPLEAPAESTESLTPETPAGGTLVVFFSRAGENHPNLDLEVGNTAQVAGFIHDRVGGTLFEIVPATPYPTSYDETTDLARQELDDQVYPAIDGELPDTTAYDTVFLGSPNWWGEQPMVVQTFLRDTELDHATIIPFITHEGSTFGNSLSVLGGYSPTAQVLDGFAERGSTVHTDPQGTRAEVMTWLEQLGF